MSFFEDIDLGGNVWTDKPGTEEAGIELTDFAKEHQDTIKSTLTSGVTTLGQKAWDWIRRPKAPAPEAKKPEPKAPDAEQPLGTTPKPTKPTAPKRAVTLPEWHSPPSPVQKAGDAAFKRKRDLDGEPDLEFYKRGPDPKRPYFYGFIAVLTLGLVLTSSFLAVNNNELKACRSPGGKKAETVTVTHIATHTPSANTTTVVSTVISTSITATLEVITTTRTLAPPVQETTVFVTGTKPAGPGETDTKLPPSPAVTVTRKT